MARAGREREGQRWVVVLAGGAGRRLRTLTSDAYGRTVPKQYCALRGERSLLQIALARADKQAPRDRQLVVVDRAHEHWWSRELADLPRENVVVQPADRGTAVGLFLPLLAIHRRDPRARVVVLPSDHYFGREDRLAAALKRAAGEIGRRPGGVVLLGVEAAAPDPELGWMELGAVAADSPLHRVVSFHEKPSPGKAAWLFERGALVSSMILVARSEDLLEFFRRHSVLPERFRAPLAHGELAGDELHRIYGALEPVDLSADLLQGAAEELLALRLDGCEWADLGTERAVRRCLLRQRPPALASLTGCRAPVDLSAPRLPRTLCSDLPRDELARFVEML